MRLPYRIRSKVNLHKSRLPEDWAGRDDWQEINGEYRLPGYRVLNEGERMGYVIAQVKNVSFGMR